MSLRQHRTPKARLRLETLEDRANPSTAYLATDLISDQPGVAAITDPTLVNAWGISLNPNGGGFWVSANGADLSEVYGGDVAGSAIRQPFKVNIPGGSPTGQVFNATTEFKVSGVKADGTRTSAPSAFIFASEAGDVTGWNPGVFTAAGQAPPSKNAVVGYQAPDGAVYKGMALANNGTGNFLYLADFHNGKIDVLNSSFQKVHLAGSFTDPNLPAGYAPFDVAAIGGKLYVTYAKQDAAAHDDVAGKGHGFVTVFDLSGHFLQRLASRGHLNSPWGMALAPAGFGDFSGDLLVGNFGDGKIHAFDPTSGKEAGTLKDNTGRDVVIDGLWGLAFGNGKTAGDATSLYFAAGPDHEAHGLFGKITANPAGTNPVTAKLVGSDLVITGSRSNDVIEVEPGRGGTLVVESDEQVIGTFDAASVATIRFNGFSGNDVFVVDPRITITVFASAGAGNDVLIGGNGDNILVGGTGNDVLIGGHGRDILIGGTGHDFIAGRGGDDILIGGSTIYDNNPTALFQILGVWASPTMSYNDRTAAIAVGTGGVPKLDATTVTANGNHDILVGGSGMDWFFSTPPSRIFGKRPGERVN